MSGYKQSCRYCDKLVEADANVCPFCGKVNPIGDLRCQKCRAPIKMAPQRNLWVNLMAI